LRASGALTSPRILRQDRPQDKVWLRCSYPVVSEGLTQVLEGVAEVYEEIPSEPTSSFCVVLCPKMEDVAREVRDVRRLIPDAPVLVVGLLNDVQCARSALRAGATGFIHVGMGVSQMHRALHLACQGEVVVPRDLVAQLVKEEETIDPLVLTARQREILGLVAQGMTNAQIAKELFLSEYTIKQHLRAAYKLLGVHNRVEAARIYSRSLEDH
jgi:DNA-binding NarL/FixJ family response regulator